jgi:hypothetical protein
MFRSALPVFLYVAILFNCAISQTNIITNGDFSKDSTGWNSLGVYGDAQATGSIVNSAYFISIQNPGSEAWNIQFTQYGIELDSGAIYSFSFDASASSSRTIESNIEMNGDAYTSYSGSGSVTLTGNVQNFSRTFVMNHKSDTSARIAFNCGKYSGNVTIDNVVLSKITAPAIKLVSPSGGEQLCVGSEFDISWISVGNIGKLKLECSADYGVTWNSVSDQIDNTGSYEWTVSGSYSAWCMVRLSSADIAGVSDSNSVPFEIIPSTELVGNGYFTDSLADWSLGVYGGKASGTVSNGKYVISIDTQGTQSWQIQLSQTGIVLDSGKAYTLSFVAYSASPCSMNVNVGMSVSPYSSYIDSSKSNVGLTAVSQKYLIEFNMLKASDTNARLEFNCGLSQSTIYIDKVSLTVKQVNGIRQLGCASYGRKNYSPFTVTSLNRSLKTGLYSQTYKGSAVIVDIRGRRIRQVSGFSGDFIKSRRLSPGVYIALPEKK